MIHLRFTPQDDCYSVTFEVDDEEPEVECVTGHACWRTERWSIPACTKMCARAEYLKGLESCR